MLGLTVSVPIQTMERETRRPNVTAKAETKQIKDLRGNLT